MVRTLFLFLFGVLAAGPLSAQTRAATPGVIDGIVTSQGGTIRLGGAQVVVRNASGDEVSTILSEGDGHFRVVAVPDGRYRVTVTLAGFEPKTAAVIVGSGGTTDLSIDLPIAAISQTVEVVGSNPVVSSGATISQTESIGSREAEQLGGSGFQAAPRLLAR